MKRTLTVVSVTFVAALAGIGGWELRSTHESKTQANDYVQWAQSQKEIPVTFVITVPRDTPPDQTVYLSGSAANLGGWDGAGVPLQRQADGSCQATVQLLSGIGDEFKVTRGTWGTVERGASGEEVPNHTFVPTPGQNVSATVLSWVDHGQSVPGKVTLTGEFRMHKKFTSRLLGNDRNIIVYLPPDYDASADRRYPVLYMQDGQNIFDASTSFNGIEWQLDEAAQNLIAQQKIQPLIIVGIYNSPDRTAEFTPFDKTPAGDPGRGALYGRFIVEELKPMIDAAYRTLPDRAHTGIGGAAQGGLIALAVAHDHPDIFGFAGALDPWLVEGGQSILDTWKDGNWARGLRLYVDMGTAGKDLYPGDSEAADEGKLAKMLQDAGLKQGSDMDVRLDQGAEHNEMSWQKRVPDMLTFLAGNS